MHQNSSNSIYRVLAMIFFVLMGSQSSAQNFPVIEDTFLAGTSFGMRHHIQRVERCRPVEMRTDAFYDASASPQIWRSYNFDTLRGFCGKPYDQDFVVNIRYHVFGTHVSNFSITTGKNADGSIKIEVTNFERISSPSRELDPFVSWFRSGRSKQLPRDLELNLTGDALQDYQFAMAVDRSVFGQPVDDAPNGYGVFNGVWKVNDAALLQQLSDQDHPDAMHMTHQRLYRDIKEINSEAAAEAAFQRIKRFIDANLLEGYMFAANFTPDGKRKEVKRARTREKLELGDILLGLLAVGVALNAVLPDQPQWSDDDRLRQRAYEQEQRRLQLGINTDLAIGWLN